MHRPNGGVQGGAREKYKMGWCCTMYTLYKTINGEKTIIAYCESPVEGAQAIEADIQAYRDDANYELIRDGVKA